MNWYLRSIADYGTPCGHVHVAGVGRVLAECGAPFLPRMNETRWHSVVSSCLVLPLSPTKWARNTSASR
jgi:hypothetical protein